MAKPTLKQQKFVEGLVAGKSMRQAALDAGYSESVADNARTEILEHLGTQKLVKSLADVLEEKGIDNEFISDKLKEGMSAKRQSITGDWYDDYATRHKYLETAIKIKGELIEKTDITSGGKPIPILGGLTNETKDSE